MSVASALAAGRARANSRMTSTATIKRQSGTTTDANGYEVPEWVVVDPDCPGRLAGSPRGGSGSRTVNVGGVEVTLALREWHMPVSRSAPADGDLIEILTGENAGAVLRVVEGSGQDQATARRIPVVETQRPTEWS